MSIHLLLHIFDFRLHSEISFPFNPYASQEGTWPPKTLPKWYSLRRDLDPKGFLHGFQFWLKRHFPGKQLSRDSGRTLSSERSNGMFHRDGSIISLFLRLDMAKYQMTSRYQSFQLFQFHIPFLVVHIYKNTIPWHTMASSPRNTRSRWASPPLWRRSGSTLPWWWIVGPPAARRTNQPLRCARRLRRSWGVGGLGGCWVMGELGGNRVFGLVHPWRVFSRTWWFFWIGFVQYWGTSYRWTREQHGGTTKYFF